MVRFRALSLALGLALVSTAATAQGRWYYEDYPAAMSPQQAAIAVRTAGLRAVAPPVRRGQYYVVPSVDRYGRMNRAFVDVRLGQVVRIRPMAVAAYGRPPAPIPRVWAPGPMTDEDDLPAAGPAYPGAPVASLPPGPARVPPTTGRAHIDPNDDLGPPPSRLPQRQAKPTGPASAAAHPTPPRNIPGVKARPKTQEPKTAAAPANAPAGEAKPADASGKPPRVVLPGGPAVKGEAQAAAPAAAPAEANKLAGENPPPAAKPDAPAPTSNGIPPMPPMQSYE